ncbi:hypothetical protein OS493_038621 [Desmophyllum pertusum]|uniref:Uncharacterized protein n=1 Tax=Desmophyllum pertusum TaxID=174260 RepID=A0A9W9ZHN5_9CNID|nr:hypothetical protein OS493_038621 [Desmophyllum pertusum]
MQEHLCQRISENTSKEAVESYFDEIGALEDVVFSPSWDEEEKPKRVIVYFKDKKKNDKKAESSPAKDEDNEEANGASGDSHHHDNPLFQSEEGWKTVRTLAKNEAAEEEVSTAIQGLEGHVEEDLVEDHSIVVSRDGGPDSGPDRGPDRGAYRGPDRGSSLQGP